MREVHQVANRLVGQMTGCCISSSCGLVRVLVHAQNGAGCWVRVQLGFEEANREWFRYARLTVATRVNGRCASWERERERQS